MQLHRAPKVGLGVITLGLRQIHPNIIEKTHPDTLIRVQTDDQCQGVARTRNACLQYLMERGCDYIFMFDDDCYPLMTGWERYFIDQHQVTGIHFFGIPEAFKSKPLAVRGEEVRWDSIIGCFSFQTRRLMEEVGYYNVAYQRYGFEDVARNQRCIRSGLCGEADTFPSLIRAPAYIFSEDVYGAVSVHNLTQAEKADYIARNTAEFQKEMHSARIYYPPE